jgi:hypothetical protein
MNNESTFIAELLIIFRVNTKNIGFPTDAKKPPSRDLLEVHAKAAFQG